MATLTPLTTGLTGSANPSYVAAGAGGDEFANTDEKTILHVKNGGGGACAVTITGQQASNHGYTNNEGGSVPAGEEKFFGPFSKDRFNDVDGDVQITYDQVTSVTVAVIRLT
jgi:uncharacterized Zn-binding protein involved in type VI secretion